MSKDEITLGRFWMKMACKQTHFCLLELLW
jgi:hypothetical protein